MQNFITTSRITEFITLIRSGIDSINKASKMYVEMLEQDETVTERIIKESKFLTKSFLYNIEKIGRDQLNPQLLLANSPGYMKLRALPKRLQDKYLNESVEVLVYNDNGEIDKLKTSVRDLSADAANQVFDKSGVRSLAEQRVYLESKRNLKQRVKVKDQKYVVRKDILMVTAPCNFTKKELLNILSGMV